MRGDMPIRPKILQVVDDDMCIACGACIEACPENVVRPSYFVARYLQVIWEDQISEVLGA